MTTAARASLPGRHGAVLEVGAGTGHNLAHYGPAAASLTLTEPTPSMLRRLERTVAGVGRSAVFLQAPAENLPFDDASFDTVVCTLVLCGVDDQARAVGEIPLIRPNSCSPAGRA